MHPACVGMLMAGGLTILSSDPPLPPVVEAYKLPDQFPLSESCGRGTLANVRCAECTQCVFVGGRIQGLN